MKKLLITGSNGFVAGSVIQQAKGLEIIGIARAEKPVDAANMKYERMDLLETENLARLIETIKPDTVIHCAAVANIDFCESNPGIAEQVNVGITQTIAAACSRCGTKLIFCSTDTVFNGKKGNYTEADSPDPVNVYAITKAKAEQVVLNASPINVVARLALVTGLPVLGRGNTFLPEMIEKLSNDIKIQSPQNEIRTPIDVITVGKSLLELAQNDFGGIIHLAGNTKINRYEMIKQIAGLLGFSQQLIIPSNSNAIPGRAPRPNDASMDNMVAKQILKTPMLSLQDGLAISLHLRKTRRKNA